MDFFHFECVGAFDRRQASFQGDPVSVNTKKRRCQGRAGRSNHGSVIPRQGARHFGVRSSRRWAHYWSRNLAIQAIKGSNMHRDAPQKDTKFEFRSRLRGDEFGGGLWSHGDPHLGNVVSDKAAERCTVGRFRNHPQKNHFRLLKDTRTICSFSGKTWSVTFLGKNGCHWRFVLSQLMGGMT